MEDTVKQVIIRLERCRNSLAALAIKVRVSRGASAGNQPAGQLSPLAHPHDLETDAHAADAAVIRFQLCRARQAEEFVAPTQWNPDDGDSVLVQLAAEAAEALELAAAMIPKLGKEQPGVEAAEAQLVLAGLARTLAHSQHRRAFAASDAAKRAAAAGDSAAAGAAALQAQEAAGLAMWVACVGGLQVVGEVSCRQEAALRAAAEAVRLVQTDTTEAGTGGPSQSSASAALPEAAALTAVALPEAAALTAVALPEAAALTAVAPGAAPDSPGPSPLPPGIGHTGTASAATTSPSEGAAPASVASDAGVAVTACTLPTASATSTAVSDMSTAECAASSVPAASAQGPASPPVSAAAAATTEPASVAVPAAPAGEVATHTSVAAAVAASAAAAATEPALVPGADAAETALVGALPPAPPAAAEGPSADGDPAARPPARQARSHAAPQLMETQRVRAHADAPGPAGDTAAPAAPSKASPATADCRDEVGEACAAGPAAQPPVSPPDADLPGRGRAAGLSSAPSPAERRPGAQPSAQRRRHGAKQPPSARGRPTAVAAAPPLPPVSVPPLLEWHLSTTYSAVLAAAARKLVAQGRLTDKVLWDASVAVGRVQWVEEEEGAPIVSNVWFYPEARWVAIVLLLYSVRQIPELRISGSSGGAAANLQAFLLLMQPLQDFLPAATALCALRASGRGDNPGVAAEMAVVVVVLRLIVNTDLLPCLARVFDVLHAAAKAAIARAKEGAPPAPPPPPPQTAAAEAVEAGVAAGAPQAVAAAPASPSSVLATLLLTQLALGDTRPRHVWLSLYSLPFGLLQDLLDVDFHAQKIPPQRSDSDSDSSKGGGAALRNVLQSLRGGVLRSRVLEHAARAAALLDRAAAVLAGSGGPPKDVVFTQFMLGSLSRVAAASASTTRDVAVWADVLLSGPCVQRFLLLHTVSQLCAADGGTDYGLPRGARLPAQPAKGEPHSSTGDPSSGRHSGGQDSEGSSTGGSGGGGDGDLGGGAVLCPDVMIQALMSWMRNRARPCSDRALRAVCERLAAAALASAEAAEGSGGGAGGGGAGLSRFRPAMGLELALAALHCATALTAAGSAGSFRGLWPAVARTAEKAALRSWPKGRPLALSPLCLMTRMRLPQLQDLLAAGGGSLPAGPCPDLAAALAAGYVPALEQTIRAEMRSVQARPPETRSVVLHCLAITSGNLWQAAGVWAFGEPGAVASLVSTSAKAARAAVLTAPCRSEPDEARVAVANGLHALVGGIVEALVALSSWAGIGIQDEDWHWWRRRQWQRRQVQLSAAAAVGASAPLPTTAASGPAPVEAEAEVVGSGLRAEAASGPGPSCTAAETAARASASSPGFAGVASRRGGGGDGEGMEASAGASGPGAGSEHPQTKAGIAEASGGRGSAAGGSNALVCDPLHPLHQLALLAAFSAARWLPALRSLSSRSWNLGSPGPRTTASSPLQALSCTCVLKLAQALLHAYLDSRDAAATAAATATAAAARGPLEGGGGGSSGAAAAAAAATHPAAAGSAAAMAAAEAAEAVAEEVKSWEQLLLGELGLPGMLRDIAWVVMSSNDVGLVEELAAALRLLFVALPRWAREVVQGYSFDKVLGWLGTTLPVDGPAAAGIRHLQELATAVMAGGEPSEQDAARLHGGGGDGGSGSGAAAPWAARLGALLPPPCVVAAALGGRLPGCSYPGCTNLQDDCEAGMRLGHACTGCGCAASYCSEGCRMLHWRFGHKAGCSGGGRRRRPGGGGRDGGGGGSARRRRREEAKTAEG